MQKKISGFGSRYWMLDYWIGELTQRGTGGSKIADSVLSRGVGGLGVHRCLQVSPGLRGGKEMELGGKTLRR
jgi:hypothetical protein